MNLGNDADEPMALTSINSATLVALDTKQRTVCDFLGLFVTLAEARACFHRPPDVDDEDCVSWLRPDATELANLLAPNPEDHIEDFSVFVEEMNKTADVVWSLVYSRHSRG